LLDASYAGIDIVPPLIAANVIRVERGELAGRFLTTDITKDALPSANVILCRDCLVHLSFENIGRVIKRFRASGARWMPATTFPDGRSITTTRMEFGAR
jgi:hypothetical protein